MYGDNALTVSSRAAAFSWIKIGLLTGSSSASNNFADGIAHIQNYSNTTTYKTVLVRRNIPDTYSVETVSVWRNTDAITSLTIAAQVGNMDIGTTLALYGIKAA
jgi:hypothetical protein